MSTLIKLWQLLKASTRINQGGTYTQTRYLGMYGNFQRALPATLYALLPRARRCFLFSLLRRRNLQLTSSPPPLTPIQDLYCLGLSLGPAKSRGPLGIKYGCSPPLPLPSPTHKWAGGRGWGVWLQDFFEGLPKEICWHHSYSSS
jgi:hypothetical protein